MAFDINQHTCKHELVVVNEEKIDSLLHKYKYTYKCSKCGLIVDINNSEKVIWPLT